MLLPVISKRGPSEMFNPDWLSQVRYGIFQTYEIVAELFVLAYLIKEGFKKLWPRKRQDKTTTSK